MLYSSSPEKYIVVQEADIFSIHRDIYKLTLFILLLFLFIFYSVF